VRGGASLATVAGPQSEYVALAGAGDPDGYVDGPVGDLAVADLHVDGVDEHHRIDRLQRPVAPLGHLTDDLVGDPGEMVSLETVAS
jgi:hypothetical protein